MEFFALALLIVLNGLFAMSEIALVAARKARLMKLAAEGDSSASVALKLGEDPTQFLSTIQIGITSIGILNGIVGEAVLAAPLANWLQTLGVPATTASIGATAGVVIVITYVSIVIGELVPKRIGQLNPETIARLVARPMVTLSFLTRPFVVLLSWSTHTILRILGVRQSASSGVTEEEIHAMLEEGSEAGVIEQHQHEMVRNVFRLDDRQLGSLMIPRSDLVVVDIRKTPEENVQAMIESEHSRFPVCDGGLDNLLGVIHAKQAFARLAKGEAPDFTEQLHPCVFVPETLTGMELLEQFRASGMQMAFVIDEYGELEGIVTLQDVLEAVTGEFTPNNAEDAWAVQRHDGSWLLDGAIPIPEMKDRLGLKTVPEEDKGRYHTVSGMFMLLLGRVPATSDRVEWSGWSFEVVDMDGKRIDKVLASPIDLPDSGEADGALPWNDSENRDTSQHR
ncbi:hemolysin family protein [Metapseudomonas furukawaii]|uniref:Hemolysins and related proteins containing CBS domains n=1 Tax=Metapseudomonas furukawaii TaxID=1149133 RepID=A0AAD1C2W9_METFU|nr:hemolysin family protein [Pseudomonas furukawaii]ELS29367.1 CBS-containing domain containing hemolysin [Pseudomonas furukawaii]BAU75782.1 hemolysins and related proteins containing CBS domains [Pseudomonas furukawaii]